MFKVNSRKTRTRFEICSKLTIRTPFIVDFEHISHLASVSVVNSEQVNEV